MFVTALVIAGAVFGCNRSEKRRDDGDQGSTGDARTRALKRDWRNVGLGMSVEQAKKAASELGFVGAADCDPTEHVSRFDPELPGFEFSPTAGVSLPQCRFESPEQQKLSAQTKDLNMENRDEVAAMVLANKTATVCTAYGLRSSSRACTASTCGSWTGRAWTASEREWRKPLGYPPHALPFVSDT